MDLVENVFTKGGLKEWNQWVEKEGASLGELGESESVLKGSVGDRRNRTDWKRSQGRAEGRGI